MNSRAEEIKILAEKIKDIRVAMLTTADADGYLRSRPMATQELDRDGKLWFFTKDHSPKANSIEQDQEINVAYADDAKNLWVSVTGKASIVRDRAKIKELWKPILKAWFPDGEDDPELALICVDVESAQIWDAPSGKVVTLVALAKSLATGQPMDHEKHTQKIDLRH